MGEDPLVGEGNIIKIHVECSIKDIIELDQGRRQPKKKKQ